MISDTIINQLKFKASIDFIVKNSENEHHIKPTLIKSFD